MPELLLIVPLALFSCLAQLGAREEWLLAIALCQALEVPKKKTIVSAATLKKRLTETTAMAARLKAATQKMENVVHELEGRIHEVEATANQVHERIRKP